MAPLVRPAQIVLSLALQGQLDHKVRQAPLRDQLDQQEQREQQALLRVLRGQPDHKAQQALLQVRQVLQAQREQLVQWLGLQALLEAQDRQDLSTVVALLLLLMEHLLR